MIRKMILSIACLMAAALMPETAALAQTGGSLQWSVVEKDLGNGHTWTATWTLRDDGQSFDFDWKALHTGEHGISRNVAQLVSIDGDQIRVNRPGLGVYTGTISSDRKRISGRDSWCNCSWEVTMQEPLPLRATRLASNVRTPSPGGSPAVVRMPGTWSVVERDLGNGHTWTATWTLGGDGKSFDFDWKALHTGEHGISRNVAQLVSIDGDQIRVNRPGLGVYTGTISSDRKRINGRDSWCNCSWQVELQEPLPASFRADSGGESAGVGGTRPQPVNLNGSWQGNLLHIWQEGDQVLITASWRRANGNWVIWRAEGRIEGRFMVLPVRYSRMTEGDPAPYQGEFRLSDDGDVLHARYLQNGRVMDEQTYRRDR